MDSFEWSRIFPPWFFPAWATLLGLVIGSFANVCIHRLPEHRSLVRPRSSCPSCGRPVRVFDNLPVLSWLLLGGKCRSCKAPISGRYPLVEAAGGVLLLALALRYGPGASFAVVGVFAIILLILFFTDLETMLLPDAITLPGVVAGLLLAPWNPLLRSFSGRGSGALVLDSAAGAAAGAGLVIAVLLGWRLWSRHRLGPDASEDEKAGMGLGDLKMLAMIGAFIGLRQVFFVTFLAALLGSVVGLSLMALGTAGRRTALPFGTFLALAGLAAIFIGHEAMDWYLSLLGFR